MADVNDVHKMYEMLYEKLGAEQLLHNMYVGIDTDYAEELFQYIMDVNDIEL